uniref:Uncharacterized protein n=1 Tax=Ditylenchus dipsaci TaxID=166011 RepID=A0A915DHS6_9BILA
MATKKKKLSGSKAEQVKKWAHADEMSFLDNFIRERPEQSSVCRPRAGHRHAKYRLTMMKQQRTPVRAKKPKISPLEAKLVEIMDKPMHPIWAKRHLSGSYCILLPELKQHPEKFHSYMRMNLSEFNRLLGLVTPWLARRSIRTPINPEERLISVLAFLRALKKDYLQVPSTEEEWIDIADKLFSRWDCPNTL